MRTRALAVGLLATAALLIAPASNGTQKAHLIGVADLPDNALPGIDLDIDIDNMKKVAAIMGFRPGDMLPDPNENLSKVLIAAACAGAGLP